MIEAVFLLPVCKKDAERVVWTIKSIRKNCSNYYIYVLIDSKPNRFPSLRIFGPDIELVYAKNPSNGHWGKIWQMQNDGLLKALQRIDLSPNCIFVRIDADAMVVRPGLIDRAQKLFAENPECGQLGQCHFNISWKPLENKGWANYFRNRSTPLGLLKAFAILCLQQIGFKKAFRLTLRLKYLLNLAITNGYKLGEFAIGPCILRYDTVKKMQDQGWLADSPFRWFPKVQDDVLITPHIYAVGYKAYDDALNNGIFAICGKEPWVHPIDLCQRGHYIVHPVKYGVTMFKPYMKESELAHFLLNYNSGVHSTSRVD